MNEKETSDLSLERVECSKCGALWLNGKHMWRTGKVGDEEALSNLVCGLKNYPECINPKHKIGHYYGDKDTWEKRRGVLDKMNKEIKDA